MIRIIAKTDPDFEARVRALVDRAATIPEHIEAAARDVIRAVRKGGDAAIRELTLRFDKRTLGALELSRAEW
ncbi:MAG TPA: histidinol dehydrogenase, partial [Polyangia bacterium]